MSERMVYTCRLCERPVNPDDVLVVVEVAVPRDTAIGKAAAESLASIGRDLRDFLVIRDPDSDAYWIVERDALRQHAARISGARVVSHGPDLPARQAVERFRRKADEK